MPSSLPVPLAIVMSSFNPGGTEGQMIELARRLDRAEWRVEIACLQADGAWRDRVESIAPVTVFPVTSFRRPAVLTQLGAFASWCRRRQIALVHTTDLPSNIFGLPGALLAGVPVRIANRREINPGRTVYEIASQRAAYASAHTIVANCRAAAERLLHEGVPLRKIAVVPNGLNPPARDHEAGRLVRRAITVANLRPEKGHDVLVDAAVHVLRQVPDATFEIVGGGPALGALMAQARERRVDQAFTFAGHCDDVPSRLASADLFVLPSRSESFPNGLLEAMGAGLPVVASAVGGILELVQHGRTGLLVPPGDAEALAARLVQLMSDRALAIELGAAARTTVAARFSFDRMVGGFDLVYTSALARRGIVPVRRAELAAS